MDLILYPLPRKERATTRPEEAEGPRKERLHYAVHRSEPPEISFEPVVIFNGGLQLIGNVSVQAEIERVVGPDAIDQGVVHLRGAGSLSIRIGADVERRFRPAEPPLHEKQTFVEPLCEAAHGKMFVDVLLRLLEGLLGGRPLTVGRIPGDAANLVVRSVRIWGTVQKLPERHPTDLRVRPTPTQEVKQRQDSADRMSHQSDVRTGSVEESMQAVHDVPLHETKTLPLPTRQVGKRIRGRRSFPSRRV